MRIKINLVQRFINLFASAWFMVQYWFKDYFCKFNKIELGPSDSLIEDEVMN